MKWKLREVANDKIIIRRSETDRTIFDARILGLQNFYTTEKGRTSLELGMLKGIFNQRLWLILLQGLSL